MTETGIDITKWKPLDWKWILMFLLVVIVGLAVWTSGQWIFKQLQGAVQPAEESLAGALPD